MNDHFARERAIQSRLTPFRVLVSYYKRRTSALRHVTREKFGVQVIWSSRISRHQTWMDHRRQEGRRGRSADHPERSRRDRSAHHPEWRSLGSQPGWDER